MYCTTVIKYIQPICKPAIHSSTNIYVPSSHAKRCLKMLKDGIPKNARSHAYHNISKSTLRSSLYNIRARSNAGQFPYNEMRPALHPQLRFQL